MLPSQLPRARNTGPTAEHGVIKPLSIASIGYLQTIDRTPRFLSTRRGPRAPTNKVKMMHGAHKFAHGQEPATARLRRFLLPISNGVLGDFILNMEMVLVL
jgi:hypothetical protein